MSTPALIRPAPGATPASRAIVTGHPRGLPNDLLRDASRRLAVIALLAAVLWIVASFLGHIAGASMSGGRLPWYRVDVTDAFVLGGALTSIGFYAWARRETSDPKRVLDLGLVFLVLTTLPLALMNHWGLPPRGYLIKPEISWAGAVVLMFAAIVPNAPWKVLIAGFVAVSMNPLSMWIAHLRGTWPEGSFGAAMLMHYTDYLLVGAAVVISHVVTRMGQQVTKAREMGSYKVGGLIGRGGMGEVYRATHRMLARPAAIKLIRPETLGPAESQATQLTLKRFRREAEVAASLRSPHTVEIYDFGVTDDGTLYYVMELLSGMDLETLVREHGPLPAARVVHLLQQACESLEEAHAVGLVHRDIKPANIFVGKQGLRHDFVKVLDFGLVKPTLSSGHEPSLATAEGLTPGTPAYMAPETALGEAVDGRADVYALGCVAYWLLTGCLVFEAENALQMIARHLQAEPVPPSRRTTLPVPPPLDRFVIACLAKAPSARPDAVECGRWLSHIGGGEWGEEQAIEWWRTHPHAMELRQTSPAAVS